MIGEFLQLLGVRTWEEAEKEVQRLKALDGTEWTEVPMRIVGVTELSVDELRKLKVVHGSMWGRRVPSLSIGQAYFVAESRDWSIPQPLVAEISDWKLLYFGQKAWAAQSYAQPASYVAGAHGTAYALPGGPAVAGHEGRAHGSESSVVVAGHQGHAVAGPGAVAVVGERGYAEVGPGGVAVASRSGTAMAGHHSLAVAGSGGRAEVGESSVAVGPSSAKLRGLRGSTLVWAFHEVDGGPVSVVVGKDVDPGVWYHLRGGKVVRFEEPKAEVAQQSTRGT